MGKVKIHKSADLQEVILETLEGNEGKKGRANRGEFLYKNLHMVLNK